MDTPPTGFTTLGTLRSSGPGRLVAARDPRGDVVVVRHLDGEAWFDGLVERYRAEAEVLRRVGSPQLFGVREVVALEGGGAAVVIEIADGAPLRRLLSRSEWLYPQAALLVLRDLLNALEAAHAAGVVHGDVNCDNAVVDRGGRVLLGALGIAAWSESDGIPHGDLACMAPERWSTGATSASADLYAAACVGYACFCGHPPFCEADPESLRAAHLGGGVPLSCLPEAVRPLLERSLAASPLQRHPSAAAFRDAVTSSAQQWYGPRWDVVGRHHLAGAVRRLAMAGPWAALLPSERRARRLRPAPWPRVTARA